VSANELQDNFVANRRSLKMITAAGRLRTTPAEEFLPKLRRQHEKVTQAQFVTKGLLYQQLLFSTRKKMTGEEEGDEGWDKFSEIFGFLALWAFFLREVLRQSLDMKISILIFDFFCRRGVKKSSTFFLPKFDKKSECERVRRGGFIELYGSLSKIRNAYT
jgi:hypothetical protein